MIIFHSIYFKYPFIQILKCGKYFFTLLSGVSEVCLFLKIPEICPNFLLK